MTLCESVKLFSNPLNIWLFLKPTQKEKKSNSVIQGDIHNLGTEQKVQEVNVSLHSMGVKCWEPQLCEPIKPKSVTCVSYAIK